MLKRSLIATLILTLFLTACSAQNQPPLQWT